jgi:hypothetical protein
MDVSVFSPSMCRAVNCTQAPDGAPRALALIYASFGAF